MRSPVVPRAPRTGRRQRTAIKTTAVALALSAALAACGGGGSAAAPDDAAGTPVRGGTLTLAEGNTAPNINPYPVGAQTDATQQINTMIYETLLNRDADGNTVAGGLAESFQHPDPTTYVVKLRPGVKFHSGATLTADDVAYTYSRAKDPATGYTVGPAQLASMASVTAVDPTTVRFTLTAPDSGFLSKLSSEYYWIIEKKWTQDHNGDLNTFPNGTGAFKVAKFVPNTEFRAEAFADYWNPELPYLDAVEVKTIPDISTRVAAVRTDDADIVQFPFDQARLLDSLTGVQKIKAIPIQPQVLPMSCKIAPFNDIRTRQAFLNAIDFKAVAAGVVAGEVQPLSYMVAPDYPKWGVPVGSEYPYPAQDIAKAKQLLAEAGHADGLTVDVEILAGPSADYSKRTMELIAQQVAPAGITVNIKQLDLATFVNNMTSSKVVADQTSYPINEDPSGWWTGYVKSTSNAYGCTDDKINELVAQEKAATDDATRKDLIKQIVVYAQAQAFNPVLYATPARITVVQDNVKNYVPTPTARWNNVKSTWKTTSS